MIVDLQLEGADAKSGSGGKEQHVIVCEPHTMAGAFCDDALYSPNDACLSHVLIFFSLSLFLALLSFLRWRSSTSR